MIIDEMYPPYNPQLYPIEFILPPQVFGGRGIRPYQTSVQAPRLRQPGAACRDRGEIGKIEHPRALPKWKRRTDMGMVCG